MDDNKSCMEKNADPHRCAEIVARQPILEDCGASGAAIEIIKATAGSSVHAAGGRSLAPLPSMERRKPRQGSDVASWLRARGLERWETELKNLGADTLDRLALVRGNDLDEIGMRRLEKRQFLREAEKLSSTQD
jgi:hypothetical protein